MVRPRLTDAEFFFKTDLKQKLVDRLPRLETVLFQQQLGTLKDKTDRIEQLAGEIAKQIGVWYFKVNPIATRSLKFRISDSI